MQTTLTSRRSGTRSKATASIPADGNRKVKVNTPKETQRCHANSCLVCIQSHWTILLVTALVFCVLFGAGLTLVMMQSTAIQDEVEDEALDMATETATWFGNALAQAMMPLFSLAQFATEIPQFRSLAQEIGGTNSSIGLPFRPPSTPQAPMTHREINGSSCTDTSVLTHYNEIAATIKNNANKNMLQKGVLLQLGLFPQAVACLLYPLVNRDDFPPGVVHDGRPLWGVDFLADPKVRPLAEKTIATDGLVIAGPTSLRSCADNAGCHPIVEKAFLACLSIDVQNHTMMVNNQRYNKWGMACATINWQTLVEQSGMYEKFDELDQEFHLTRTDRVYGQTEEIVEIAKSPNFSVEGSSVLKDATAVTTKVMTVNNEWEMTVQYTLEERLQWRYWVIPCIFFVSLGVSWLVFLVLIQKQTHIHMVGQTQTQEARVETERNMTAYFAHELRNPLSSIGETVG